MIQRSDNLHVLSVTANCALCGPMVYVYTRDDHKSDTFYDSIAASL